MNKNKLVACLLLALLLTSLFCLYLVATGASTLDKKDTSEHRGADVSFLFVLGVGGATFATFKLVNKQ